MGRSRASSAAAALVVTLLGACASFAPELGPIRGANVDGAPGDDAAGGAVDDAATVGSADGAGGGGDAAVAPDTAAAADAAPQTWTVVVGANGQHAFSPQGLSVRVGDTVHWVWQQSEHTVTSGTGGVADGLFCSPSDSGCASAPTSSAGSSYDHVFAAPGTYPYFCRLHWDSGMVGTITVQ